MLTCIISSKILCTTDQMPSINCWINLQYFKDLLSENVCVCCVFNVAGKPHTNKVHVHQSCTHVQ